MRQFTCIAISSAAGLLAAVLAGGVQAGNSTGILTATITIKSNCHLTATSEVSFGTVDPTTPSNVSGAGSISVACTKGTTISSIVLNQGNNFGGSTRRMSDGTGDFVAYELYTDSSHTTLWGDNTSGIGGALASGFTASSSAGAAQSFSVYGLVRANAVDVPANTYNDTVNVTVNF